MRVGPKPAAIKQHNAAVNKTVQSAKSGGEGSASVSRPNGTTTSASWGDGQAAVTTTGAKGQVSTSVQGGKTDDGFEVTRSSNWENFQNGNTGSSWSVNNQDSFSAGRSLDRAKGPDVSQGISVDKEAGVVNKQTTVSRENGTSQSRASSDSDSYHWHGKSATHANGDTTSSGVYVDKQSGDVATERKLDRATGPDVTQATSYDASEGAHNRATTVTHEDGTSRSRSRSDSDSYHWHGNSSTNANGDTASSGLYVDKETGNVAAESSRQNADGTSTSRAATDTGEELWTSNTRADGSTVNRHLDEDGMDISVTDADGNVVASNYDDSKTYDADMAQQLLANMSRFRG